MRKRSAIKAIKDFPDVIKLDDLNRKIGYYRED